MTDFDNRKVLQDRRRILLEQPDVRWINLIETDGVTTSSRKHLVRLNQTKNIDHLKTQLTQTLQPPLGAVRNIYTPAGGTVVTDLNQIQPQKSYVVGMGNQRYNKISQLLKEHEENKKKILSQLARQQSQGRSTTSNSLEGPITKRSIVMPQNRLSLMDRQDMIAQRARGNSDSSNMEITRRPPPPNVPKRTVRGAPPRKIVPNRKPLFPARRTSATQTPPKSKTMRSAPATKFPSNKNMLKPGTQAVIASRKPGGIGAIVMAPIPVTRDITRKSSRRSTALSSRKSTAATKSEKSGSRSGSESGKSGGSRSGSGSRHSSGSRKSGASESRDRSRSGSSKSNSTGRTMTGITRGSAISKRTRKSVLTRRSESRSRSRSDSRGSGKSGKSSRASSRASLKTGKSSRASSRASGRSGKSSRASSRASGRSGKSSRASSRASGRSGKSSRASSKGSGKSGKSSRASSRASGRSGKSSRASSRASSKGSVSRKSSRASSGRSTRASSRKSDRSGRSTRGSSNGSAKTSKSSRSNLTTKSGRSNASSSKTHRLSTSKSSNSRLSTNSSRKSSGASSHKSSHGSGKSSQASTRRSTATIRRSVLSKKSDEIMDNGSDTDDEKGQSHRLRYGSKFGTSTRSHRMTIRSAGAGAMNNDAPSPLSMSPLEIHDRDKSAFLFRNSPLLSRAQTRALEVDYDTDESGIFRAKSARPETSGANEILESSRTKIDLPVDLMPTEEVTNEDIALRKD